MIPAAPRTRAPNAAPTEGGSPTQGVWGRMRQDPLPQPLDDVTSCPRHHLDPGVGNVLLPPASVSGGGFRVQLTEEHEGLGRDVARIEAGVRVEGRRNAA